jgi:hypothetical protein
MTQEDHLFPDQAFEGWKPNDRVQKVVNENLKEDPTLKEEAKRWDKEKDDD